MSVEAFLIMLAAAALAAGGSAFLRPRGVMRRAGLVIVLALAFPFIVAFVVGPLLGSGAGFGVALILYVVSGFAITLAVFALIGAGLRHGWNALR